MRSRAGSRVQSQGGRGPAILPAQAPTPCSRAEGGTPQCRGEGRRKVPAAPLPAPRRCFSVGGSAVNAWAVAALPRPRSRCGGRGRPAEPRAQRGMGARAAGGGCAPRSLLLRAGRGCRRAEVSAAAAAFHGDFGCGQKKKSERSVKKSRSLPRPVWEAEGIGRGAAELFTRPSPGTTTPSTLGSRLNICGPWVQIVLAGFFVREQSVLLPARNGSGASAAARPGLGRAQLPCPCPRHLRRVGRNSHGIFFQKRKLLVLKAPAPVNFSLYHFKSAN